MNWLPEKSEARTTVHKTTKLKSRRKKVFAFDGADGTGVGASVMRTSNRAEAAVPPGIFFERFEELRFAKVGPERRGHHQFGVGNLPGHEITDAHWAARANQQIR